MRAVITSESRFVRSPDGLVWTRTGPATPFWERYLGVFDRVRVVARVLDVATVPDDAVRVDGGQVEVWPVPYYVGPRQYLARWPAVRRSVLAAADGDDAVILRVPSPIGSMLASARRRRRLPYALEVVGDPYDVFGPGVIGQPLRPILRASSAAGLRRQCRRASATAYVTERALQRRYPAAKQAPTAAFSDIELGPDAFVTRTPAVRPPHQGQPRLVSVGSLEQLYKGIDTLVEALCLLNDQGHRARLVHVGDGRFRPHLEQLAARRGVADQVTFAGAVPPGEAVRHHLDDADLFVMPSRTEGLPRALIEAMARGLPAVATAVGGIPELLPAEHLVAPDAPAELAAAISRLLAEPWMMAAASKRNLAQARDFAIDRISRRRTDYYAAVCAAAGRTAAQPGKPSRR